MTPNMVNGPLDGAYIPHGGKEYVMVTAYDDTSNPSSVVYWWQRDIERWVYQRDATTRAMAGVVEKHTATDEGGGR